MESPGGVSKKYCCLDSTSRDSELLGLGFDWALGALRGLQVILSATQVTTTDLKLSAGA